VASSSESWPERRAVIRELLARETLRSQAELVTALRRRGFVVTQSSVSRDLAELHAYKVDGRYVTAEALAPPAAAVGPGRDDALADVLEVRPAGPHLLIIHTPIGRAAPVALALDRAAWRGVVGTIAGDDTVLIALAGRRDQARVQALLTQLVAENSDV
jgi:transcriptional regulator of arginine metabolism